MEIALELTSRALVYKPALWRTMLCHHFISVSLKLLTNNIPCSLTTSGAVVNVKMSWHMRNCSEGNRLMLGSCSQLCLKQLLDVH